MLATQRHLGIVDFDIMWYRKSRIYQRCSTM